LGGNLLDGIQSTLGYDIDKSIVIKHVSLVIDPSLKPHFYCLFTRVDHLQYTSFAKRSIFSLESEHGLGISRRTSRVGVVLISYQVVSFRVVVRDQGESVWSSRFELRGSLRDSVCVSLTRE
jgi:hypothetical protein